MIDKLDFTRIIWIMNHIKPYLKYLVFIDALMMRGN